MFLKIKARPGREKPGERRNMNYKTLEARINKLEPGTRFYINAINLSANAIQSLRGLIQDGTLKPVEEEIRKAVVADAVHDFMSGKSILPQMSYIKSGNM